MNQLGEIVDGQYDEQNSAVDNILNMEHPRT